MPGLDRSDIKAIPLPSGSQAGSESWEEPEVIFLDDPGTSVDAIQIVDTAFFAYTLTPGQGGRVGYSGAIWGKFDAVRFLQIAQLMG